MAERNVILEGPVKFRLKKKWKSRWCILKKLSPVADRLNISLYKDAHNCRDGHEKANIPLEDFFGVECGITLEKECHVMAILCRKQVLFLAFPSRESLKQWEATIQTELGEDRQFPVSLVKGPKDAHLPLGKVKLCIQGQNLCIVTLGLSPPEVLSSWHVTDLRRFGVIDNKFCFEGGSQCGQTGAGVHVFLTEHGEEINRLLQQASRKLLSRANSSATCRRNVPVNQRGSSFRSCSAFLDWTQLYTDSDRLYEAHGGLRTSQLEHNDTSSDDADGDYQFAIEEQKLRSIDRWNRDRLNTIYNTSSCPDCHSGGFSQASSYLNVGGSVAAARPGARNGVSPARSARSVHARLPASCAAESKDCRSVASSDSDDVFTTVESDYYNILPAGGTCSFPADSPAKCSSIPNGAPRGESVLQSKPQSIVLQAVKSVAYRNKRNRIVHRSYTLPRTIHECRTDIYPPDSPGSLSNDTSSNTSNTAHTVDDSGDSLSDSFQTYRVSDYERVIVYDAVGDSRRPSNFYNDVKTRTTLTADTDSCGESTMALPGCRANSSMSSHAYGAARVCSTSSNNESPYMNLSIPQKRKVSVACGVQSQDVRNGEVRIDPLLPLEYIDLNRFDGADDKYSCWLRGRSETPPPTLPPPPPPPIRIDAQERRSSEGGACPGNTQATPVSSGDCKVELPKKRVSKPNRFLSFHGSLKRQNKSKGSVKSLQDESVSRGSTNSVHAGGSTNSVHAGGSTNSVHAGGSTNSVHAGGSTNSVHAGGSTNSVHAGGSTNSVHAGKLQRCSSFCYAPPQLGSRSMDCVNQTSSVASPAVSESGGLPPRPTRAPSMQSVSEYLTPVPSQPSSSQHNVASKCEYMMMDPNSTTVVSGTSNTVFCTVDLPLKRTNSAGSRKSSLCGSVNGFTIPSDGGYMDPSRVNDAVKARGRSMSLRDQPGMSRAPALSHAKSWDNELESNYLQMSCSSAAPDYIKMSSADIERLSSDAQQLDTQLLKPFDNLLEHKHHLSRKPMVAPRGVLPFNYADRIGGGDSKPSSDEDVSSKSGKTPGLLSRLIRRNSSKKASRSQEDILAATSSIETVPELPPSVISHVRTKSADMLDDRDTPPSSAAPDRQRSMSYSDMSASRFSLADQTSRSRLYAVPPAPGAQPDTGLFVSVPPPVPPRAPGSCSSSGGKSDAASYVTVTTASNDGAYYSAGAGVSSCRRVSEGPYISTGYPRSVTTSSESVSSRSVENMLSRNGQPMANSHTPRTSRCMSGQSSDVPRSGDVSPEADYLMVWADSPGRTSCGASPANVAVPLSNRTTNLLDRSPAGRRRSSNTSELYARLPQDSVQSTKTDPIPIPSIQSRLTEDDRSSSSSPPALPEKTYRRGSYSRRAYLTLPARRRTTEAPLADSPCHSCYSSDADSVGLPRTGKDASAAQKLKHIPSLRVSIPPLTISQEEEHDGIWMHGDIAATQEEPGSCRSIANGAASYDSAETMSVMSHGSSDTPSSSVRSDELKNCTSPASTTLRPRSGKEYKKLDRRKLAEDLNIPLEELLPPKSPSVSSSVFTFDSATSLRASPASGFSCGEDSPNMLSQHREYVNRSNSLRSSEACHHRDYVNRSESLRSSDACTHRNYVNHSDSLHLSDASPPGSCTCLAPDATEALLNYAEIDLSDSESSRLPGRNGNEIEYAVIDMVATVTASRVGKEHAQLREDKLEQNVQRQDSRNERETHHVTRRIKEKRFSSLSSKDKKLSLTSIISSNSKGKKSSL